MNAETRGYDRDTGQLLSEHEETAARDNPGIYRWVEWRQVA